ncbi:hypothetical protein HLB23_03600 [Nocardia uniformis]|uniref:Uncharacterized protein n=1 Tax=Nocardia uniformis TaxID=53432 RepID=A0A849BVJ9_9NOCA|nr:hypothetical protein [Nocardia uniformis]
MVFEAEAAEQAFVQGLGLLAYRLDDGDEPSETVRATPHLSEPARSVIRRCGSR